MQTFYVNGISTLLSNRRDAHWGIHNDFLIKCDAWIRVIIPSSGDDAMAENRCRDAEKVLYRES